jgi:CRISPR system Cascade subunit CasD
MTEVLIFRLFGPLASWGEIAVGEIRPSAIRPTRSALLGLLAAALGMERHAGDEAHQALSDEVRFAVRVDAPGKALVDYHTVNYRFPERKERIVTRRDEVAVPRRMLETAQSWRHYRCDAVVTVAVRVADGAATTLSALAGALRCPAFPLFLGRKSCPLALPAGPTIVEAADLRSAFERYDELLPARELRRLTQYQERVEITVDHDFGLAPGFEVSSTQSVDRRDQPLSRLRRRFVMRREQVINVRRIERGKEETHVPDAVEPG